MTDNSWFVLLVIFLNYKVAFKQSQHSRYAFINYHNFYYEFIFKARLIISLQFLFGQTLYANHEFYSRWPPCRLSVRLPVRNNAAFGCVVVSLWGLLYSSMGLWRAWCDSLSEMREVMSGYDMTKETQRYYDPQNNHRISPQTTVILRKYVFRQPMANWCLKLCLRWHYI